jgi:hypothetical protein
MKSLSASARIGCGFGGAVLLLCTGAADAGAAVRGNQITATTTLRQPVKAEERPAASSAVEVIYTKIPTHSSSVVPGARDAAGNPITVNFRGITDLVGSPDGSQWLLWGSTHPDASYGHRFIIHGSGTQGEIITQEELQVPDSDPGVVFDFFPAGVGRFNEANDYVFTARAKNEPLHYRQRVLISLDGVISEWARESDLYFGLLDQFDQPATTAAIGNSIGSVHLLNDGTVGAHDNTIKAAPGGALLHSTRRPALTFDRISFHQRGVTRVTSLNGQNQEHWVGIGLNAFFSTPDFSPISLSGAWITRGQIDYPVGFQHVVVVNDQVRMQQGFAIPGSSIVPMGAQAGTNPFFSADVAPNGDWYVRGQFDDGARRFAARNGDIVAVDDDAVPGTVNERWISFTHFSGDRNGNWIMIGRTTHPDPTLDEVVVVNGEIVLRRGDQIDLPGFAGDVFIGRANPANAAFPGDVFLSEDGWLYVFANIYDGDETDYNSEPAFGSPTAFIRVQLEAATECVGDLNGDGEVDVLDLLQLLDSWGPCPGCDADLNGDDEVDVLDLLILLDAWGPCP